MALWMAPRMEAPTDYNHELGPARDMPLTHVAQLEKRYTNMCLEVGGSHVNDQQVLDHLL